MSKGNVGEVPDYATKDPSNLLLGQPDGTFVEGAPDGRDRHRSTRGAARRSPTSTRTACSTSSRSNLDAPVRLWRNVGSGSADAPAPMGGWLALRLGQPGGNRDAIGAVIETKTGDAVQRHEVMVGGGHIGGQLGWQHVGIGPATEAQVRVTWPDGEVGPLAHRRREPVPRHRARRDPGDPVVAAQPVTEVRR